MLNNRKLYRFLGNSQCFIFLWHCIDMHQLMCHFRLFFLFIRILRNDFCEIYFKTFNLVTMHWRESLIQTFKLSLNNFFTFGHFLLSYFFLLLLRIFLLIITLFWAIFWRYFTLPLAKHLCFLLRLHFSLKQLALLLFYCYHCILNIKLDLPFSLFSLYLHFFIFKQEPLFLKI